MGEESRPISEEKSSERDPNLLFGLLQPFFDIFVILNVFFCPLAYWWGVLGGLLPPKRSTPKKKKKKGKEMKRKEKKGGKG